MEGEIEYLDEDADLVQQCVHIVDSPTPVFSVETELLVERLPNELSQKKSDRVSYKRKRTKNVDDSDYDPSEESRNKKRKSTQNLSRQGLRKVQHSDVKSKKETGRIQKKLVPSKLNLAERRKLDIRIPDYDDPLCLPVRGIPRDREEEIKLISWNNMCLDKFKGFDTPMRVDKDETVASKRTVVLRNLRNISGRIETTMYSKITVENAKGSKKSELIRSVLPRYREKKLLNNFRLYGKQKNTPIYHKTEVILTKEKNKDVENLVVYNPDETLSSVYNMQVIDSETDPQESKKYLKEIACCKMCAPCYHGSYRGCKKNNQEKVYCQVCKRACVNVYNLVSHLKTHSHMEIKRHKSMLSKILAEKVPFHYQCRICQQKLPSIKELRTHVNTHRGKILFICDIGNHLTK